VAGVAVHPPSPSKFVVGLLNASYAAAAIDRFVLSYFVSPLIGVSNTRVRAGRR
jgi:hypothetical protein